VQDVLQYEGKRVVVTGAASGMGAATVAILQDLGAEVTALDINDVTIEGVTSIRVDLSDEASIDAAVDAIEGPVDSLFCCAGLPTTAPGQLVMKVNFIGHRHLIESLVPEMPEGSSVGIISSAGGMGWQQSLDVINELLDTPDVASAVQWCSEHDVCDLNGYGFSKEALNAYTASRGVSLAEQGIRLNAINPGPTDTPMMPSFIETMGADFMASLPRPLGRNSTPEEQAWPLVMVNSPRQSYTAGSVIYTDGAFSSGLITNKLDFSALG
jgi:NAD(P)-dependent dehydrogenase (short-subunit alcohol dehydrogenase family)